MLLCLDRTNKDRTASGETENAAFRQDILAGLSATPKRTPPHWFYDRRGSELFEQITELPEYYPTRTETALLAAHAGDIHAHVGSGRAVVEFGAGSSTKTPYLLRGVAAAAYVAIDISGDFLRESSATLAVQFPELPVIAVEADFTHEADIPCGVRALPRLGFFPGSTIGNMVPSDAVDLLRTMRRSLGDGAFLLIGMDRIKDPGILIPAYDDAARVTAAFNCNLLVRINRELDGDIPVDAFAHRAIWNDDAARIEMHLEAQRNMRFRVAGEDFTMARGETIHTENSHKYGPRDARLLLRAGGWEPVQAWTDERELFTLFLARAASAGL
jgi:dimethylhistidine N-methyltransferase